jgi:hypothetical protein
MKKLLYIFILAGLFSAGCKKVDSGDLKDEVPYYQTYEIAYYKHDNQYTGKAGFLVRDANGTRITLTDNAAVRLNGNVPQYSATGATYSWTGSGMPDANFVLTKNSGKAVTNLVKRSEIADIDFAAGFPTSASKAAGFSFNWVGNTPDSTTEWMTVTISAYSSTTGSYTITGKDVKTSTVTITAADLANCPTGKIFVELVRGKTMALKETDDNAGGNITIRLQTQKELTLNN